MKINPHLLQQPCFVGGSEHGFVVTMFMHESTAAKSRWAVLQAADKKLRQHEGLFGELAGPLIVREEVDQLVAKYRNASGLQTDDRHTRIDFRLQRTDNLQQPALCQRQQAEIVERSSTAQSLSGDVHLTA